MLEGKLNEEQTQKIGFSFFGTQGPWYTVGWKMCDQRKLLSTYNQAAASYNRHSGEPLALWPNAVISRLSKVENG